MSKTVRSITASANQYDGEKIVRLHDKDYPMRVNMGVIAKFQTETGHDYMLCAVKAMNAMRKAGVLESAIDQAEVMTEAVPMFDAAWFFYLAAKELDSTVTFEEIQEAVLLEGPLRQIRGDGVSQSYPVLFADLAMFSILGASDTAKKH